MPSPKSLLTPLRSLLSKHTLSAYIIPTNDPHLSEYVSEYHGRREYLSGFSGSAGVAIVWQWERIGMKENKADETSSTATKTLPGAFLWTDSRYTLQAHKELDASQWNVMIYPHPELNYPEWFEKHGEAIRNWMREEVPDTLSNNATPAIGIDPQLITLKEYRQLSQKLSSAGFHLELLSENLVDQLWDSRPPVPSAPIITLPEKYSGRSVADKLAAVRSEMRKKSCRYMITGMLDEIAWLLNLRGSDISYNPVFLSYCVISLDSVTLYFGEENDARLNANGVKEHLEKEQIHVRPYNLFIHDMTHLHVDSPEHKIWISPLNTNMATCQALNFNLSSTSLIHEEDSYLEKLKAIKNETEIAGFRACNIRDGAALCKFFAWLENELVNEKNTSITEVSAAKKLLDFRRQQSMFVSESFAPIVGYGANGAIVHYHALEESCATLGTDSMLLLDSGGQYMDGTTDTTRTMHFGTPTQEERENFTRVLKGHIAMDDFVFPDKTLGGLQLDIVARQFLWRIGLDYGHGTGHLIGHFLNVHEGPAYIGYRNRERGLIPLERGMVCSNEPGYYETGKYGIRIENDLVVKKANTPHRFNDVDYLHFEHFTMVPMQTKLVVKEMLTSGELKWLNSYNAEVYEKVRPLLDGDELAMKWLEKECREL